MTEAGNNGMNTERDSLQNGENNLFSEIGESDMAPFNAEAFTNELQNLFKHWQSTWINKDRGPLFTPTRIKAMSSEEALTLQAPEDEAYGQLVKYAADGILSAIRQGIGGEAVAALKSFVHFQLSRDWKMDIVTDTFHIVATELSEQKS